jgi:hypothetical protein
MAKKKIKLILTVYEDGSFSIIEPDKEENPASTLGDGELDDNGGDRPPTGPKTP